MQPARITTVSRAMHCKLLRMTDNNVELKLFDELPAAYQVRFEGLQRLQKHVGRLQDDW